MTGDLDKVRQRILIVDDTPEILQFLMKVFSDLEYIVTPVSSGNMAFKAIETDPPDIILLDINMPEMDGYEVCQRLKASEAFRKIPVIFLSAMHETIDKVKAFEAGGVDYITKPFQIKEVLARVKTHLAIRDLQKQLGEQNLQLQQQITLCKQVEDELAKHKDGLEELVAERTKDLQKVNKELQKEIAERKQAEEVLKWKTALLEAQINTSIDGILVVDENQKRIIINQRIIDFWDVPKHILDDEDDTALLQYVVGLVKYPEQFIEKVMYLYGHPYETSRDEIEFKSGMVLDRYSAPVLSEDGHHYGRIWTFRDITSRKVSEDALKKSEEQFRTFFNLPIVGFAITAADSKWIHFNDTLCEMLGYSRNELERKTWMDITPAEDLEKEMVLFKEILAGGKQGSDFEKRYVHRDSSLINVHISTRVVRNDDNSIAYFASIIQDITERKLAEKLLEEQLQRFLVVTDQAPFGIVLINREGTYTYLNAKFREIFGYDLQDIPDGRTWFRKAYPDAEYRHKVIKAWFSDMNKIEENIFMTVEGRWIFTVTCKDTAEKIVSFIMLRLPTGEYLMACEDITDRRKTEEALKKREAELEIKSTNLEEMNAALKVLLKERENDKIELEEKILSNVKELVLPYIEKLKKSRLDSQHMTYVDIVETNLNDIVSPFLQKMGLKYANLTPTEIEIANLIKNGKSTKEIGNLLHMSAAAINFHRNNIRKKLGINNEKVNLRSYLMSM